MMMKLLIALSLVVLGKTADPKVYKCFEKDVNYSSGDLLSTAAIKDIKNFDECMNICKAHATCESIVYIYDTTVHNGPNGLKKKECYLKSKRYDTTDAARQSSNMKGVASGNKVCNGEKCSDEVCKPCHGVTKCEVGECNQVTGKCPCMPNAKLDADGKTCSCRKGFVKNGQTCEKGRFCTKKDCLKEDKAKGCMNSRVIVMPRVASVEECAKACVRRTRMFYFGVGIACTNGKCGCTCELAGATGTCTDSPKTNTVANRYTYQKPVDGEWSEWSGEWNTLTCNRKCGGGKKTRTRTCNNRQFGGKRCSGKAKEKLDCNTEPCDVVFKVNSKFSNKDISCKPCPCEVSFWAKPGRNTKNEELSGAFICHTEEDGTISQEKWDNGECNEVHPGTKRRGGFAKYTYTFDDPKTTNAGTYKMYVKQGDATATSKQTVTLNVKGYE